MMLIKEFPAITKEGKEIIGKTDVHQVLSQFNTMMADRGHTSFNFFVDKSSLPKIKDDKEIEDSMMPSGLTFSSDFTPEDMMSAVIGYMDVTMTQRSKLAFTTQLNNYILSDIITEEEEEEDEGLAY